MAETTPPADSGTSPAHAHRWRWAIVVLGVAAAIIAVAFVARPSQDTSPSPSASVTTGAVPTGVAGLGEPYRVGRPDAPRTLAIWADLQCPFCAKFDVQSAPALEEAVAAGDIAVEYHIAAFLGEPSVRAASALGCAADAGALTDYVNYLYAHQPQENSADAYTVDALLAAGTAVGIDPGSGFADCVAAGTYTGYANSVTAAMQKAGVTRTPTVMLDGQELNLSGVTVEQFRAILAGTQPPPIAGG